MKNRYEMEVLKTVNTETGNTTYYKKVCDVMKRISKKEYDNCRDECFGVSCRYNTVSKKHNRFYTNLTFYI